MRQQQPDSVPRITIKPTGGAKSTNKSQFVPLATKHIESAPLNTADSNGLSVSSRRLLEDNENYERLVWRAARNYQQAEHYDYSLFGLDSDLDQAVGRHQREAMLYNQGK